MDDILKVGLQYVKKHKRYPILNDLLDAGITRAKLRHKYTNMDKFYNALAKISTEHVIDLQRNRPTLRPISNFKSFVITTAVTGTEIDTKALASIRKYCDKNRAAMLVLVAKGSSAETSLVIDANIPSSAVCLDETSLNSNIKLLSILQAGTKVDPTTGGISRTGNRDSSIVVASTKQRLVYTATGMGRLPHATMGTGAISKPSYNTKTLSGYISNHDHVMGAVVVEIENDSIFHFRQVTFDSKGGFVDLGTYYNGSATKPMAPLAMVLGDWHSGKTSPSVVKASIQISKNLGIKEWVLHDAYDSHSNNHHEKGKLLLLSKKAETNELNLTKELTGLANDLNMMAGFLNKITVVKSNHDEFLDRYLDSGAWIKHPYNTKLCVELAAAMIDGKSPVEYAVTKFSPKKNNKVNWLKRDESYKIAGIECGSHGDKGPNGSRGSLTSIEKSYDKCVVGHAHTPGILRESWCVGTSTEPYPDYGTGPSSWMNTHCLLYPNGARQLINFLDGKYTIQRGK